MKDPKKTPHQLEHTLGVLDDLTRQLREVKDYSEKSEMIFLLRELVLEQIDGKLQENENTHHTNHPTR